MASKAIKTEPGAPAAKATPDYILLVQLTGTTSPTISRVLTVPASSTFHLLHLAIQLAFGWVCVHLYEFAVVKYASSTAPDPAIAWSRFDAKDVEVTIQEEEPEGVCFSTIPGMQSFKQSKTTKISELFEDAITMAGCSVEYTYDFGDGWVHTISLLGRTLTAGAKPACVAGEGLGAAEDVGGPEGWKKLKETYAAKKPSAKQKELREWYEDDCVNGHKSGLKGGGHWEWDKAEVNRRLAALPNLPIGHDSGR